MEDAALLPGPHRLEARDWIASEWGVSETTDEPVPTLTPVGRRQLRIEVSAWRRYAEAVFKIVETA
jgi:hypothetical protein